MKLIVNKNQRYAKMRAHSAAHLLNAELDKLLNGTKQAGSFVDEDYLRFDFTTDKPLTKDELSQIEKNINSTIYNAVNVENKEMEINKAIEMGAKAFFEDKYGDSVRIVNISDSDNQNISLELCGGTHVSNTSEIGAFKIIGQEAVASGIKRLIAITGPKVGEYAIQQDEDLEKLALKFNTSPKQLSDIIDKFIKENNELKSKFESMEDQMIELSLSKAYINSNEQFDIIINLSANEGLKDGNIKTISQKAKELFQDKNLLIFKEDGSYYISIGKGDINLKEFSKSTGLKGGGSENIMQGKDPNIKTIFGL